MYSGRKSCPHCDTQWASSIANSPMRTLSSKIEETRRHQALGRDIQQVDFAVAQRAFGGGRFGARQRRVQIGSAYADFLERGNLVLHQCDQRRHDDTRAEARLSSHERRNLITQRFAAARRHQHERIAAGGHVFDDFALLPSESGIAKYFVEDFERTGHGEDECVSSVSGPILPTTAPLARALNATLANRTMQIKSRSV